MFNKRIINIDDIKRMAKCYSKLHLAECRLYISYIELPLDLVWSIAQNYLKVYELLTNANIHEVVTRYCNPLTHAGFFARFGDIKYWDVSKITNMQGLFRFMKHFNEDLSKWNTGAVTNMERMFDGANLFNGNIGDWNTSKVTDMSCMFCDAVMFNQDIGSWDTTVVTDMSIMFCCAAAFNQDIGIWNTESVTNMREMFFSAASIQSEYWYMEYRERYEHDRHV